jgi:ParB-like nuclease domain
MRTNPLPLDASVAASGRTVGDVQLPPVAAVEAGRDTLREQVMSGNEPTKKPGGTIGQPPTLEWIKLESLLIDERYQRSTETPRSRNIIYGMVKCWDWRLCQPLSVSRRNDGCLYVVDGQHRLSGAQERGDIPYLPCVITSHSDHADEAETFVALNCRRQKLSQGDIFSASLASGDPHAQEVAEIVARAGLTFARHNNPTCWKAKQIFCGPAIMAALRVHGKDVVSNALVALTEAYPTQIMARAATLLKALYLIYSEDAKRPGFDPDRFIEALGSVNQTDWLEYAQMARKQSPALSTREAYAQAFMEQYDALRSAA